VSDDFPLIIKFRSLSGLPKGILRVQIFTLTLLGSLWALEVHHSLAWAFFKEQYLGKTQRGLMLDGVGSGLPYDSAEKPYECFD
jgi:hypothetical protein